MNESPAAPGRRRSATPLELLELAETAQIEALAPEWAALWERCPSATPFQHPAWLLPWWRNVWQGGRAWWIALREAGRLAAIAPMFVWGGEVRCVSIAGAGETDYLDFLIEPEHASAGAAMVLERVAADSGWDLCDFQELHEASVLPAAAPAGLNAQLETCAVCPVAALPPSCEEFEAGLSRRFRHNLHRARNRVRNAGGVVETAGPGNFGELLSALFGLHKACWKARGGPGVLAEARVEAFHCEAAREMLACGMLRLYGLRLPGGFAAALHGFAGHGRFYAYLDGFDPAHARLSPGTVLVDHAIRCAIAEGLSEFDFLREGEAYKYDWGAADRPNRRLTLRRAP
jgi:CelD/BcsL family acetyltransferase involved in cellulose biosynthesis